MPPNAPGQRQKPGTAPAFYTLEEVEQAHLNERIARAHSRNDMLRLGFLKVQDLDDEEVLAGRGREQDGTIAKWKVRSDPLPNDIYQAILQEHQTRLNERLREQMDQSLNVMIEVRDDKTAEPRDRMEAAKYLFERVAGKTPDKVIAAVAKAPWEQVFDGIAASVEPTTVADAPGQDSPRIVEAVPYGHIQTPTDPSVTLPDQEAPDTYADAQQPVQPGAGQAQPTAQPEGGQHGSTTAAGMGIHIRPMAPDRGSPGDFGHSATSARNIGAQTTSTTQPDAADLSDEDQTVPPEQFFGYGTPQNPYRNQAAPDFRHPVNTSATAPNPYQYPPPQGQQEYAEPSVPLSQQVRDSHLDAATLAAQRAEAREMRKGAKDARTKSEEGMARMGAKKRRIAFRTLGLDALHPLDVAADIQSNEDGEGTLSWRVT